MNNNLSIIDIKLLISRLLYPSFYFQIYEDILLNNKKEIIITKITKRLPEYELYLSNLINYFKNYYDIDLIKTRNSKFKSFIPHIVDKLR